MLKKIAQIVEYFRLKKEYKIKNTELNNTILDYCGAWGKINKRQQSVEGTVVHSVDPGLFGSYNYPCIVTKLGWDTNMAAIFNPDKTFYCPKYDKDENSPCEDSKCMHYQANQECFLQKEKQDKALEELKKLESAVDDARNRIFGRIK